MKKNINIGSVLLHIPVGLLAAFALSVHWSIALIIAFSFLTYEVVQMVVNLVDKYVYDRAQLLKVRDRAYPEIMGFIVGVVIGAFVLWLVR